MALGDGRKLSTSSMIDNFYFHQCIGFFVRLILIAYGSYHDRTSAVHYTDVDYHVITDAARYVDQGRSPFLRHTYRYTPFLSWIMLPNIWLDVVCGKLLFITLDCIATFIIYRTLLLLQESDTAAVRCSLLWLYNPIVIGISTRGSPESLIVTIVLFVLYLHLSSKHVLSGVALGLAVHFKLYPIIYALPLYLSLESHTNYSLEMFKPTRPRLEFALATVSSFLCFTLIGYSLYGEEYIKEGFLYHLTRVDTRHNFSVYFYLLYLSVDSVIPGLGLALFVPQAVLVAAYGLMYGIKREDLALAMFAQTVSFVTFNKVVTSQYFVWYLVFLPLLCSRLTLSLRKAIVLPSLWVCAQAAWLLPAYLFEFRGVNVFVPIWLESIAFFCCNVGILMAVISSYFTNDVTSTKPKSQ